MAGVRIKRQARTNMTKSELEYLLLDEAAEPTALPLSLLTEITNGFSNELEIGNGGFAVVYKAMLDNCAIAVKRMSNTYMYEKEFHREVECLLKVKHRNIVRFLGYCADTQGNMARYDGKMVMADVQQRLLCFEYLSNGSLERYITDSPEELEWRYRYQIIKGICEGLNHLHQKNIAHLDLKPGNILLDEEMMPKITDFGLSRCFEEAQTHVSTKNVGGTLGYLAPEFSNNKITLKFDLYSLGVVILEILTGKKGHQTVENVLEIWSYTMLDTLQLEQIRLCAKIGIECTEADPAKRPTCMKHIIDRLVETECMQANPLDGPNNKLLVIQQSMLCFLFKPNKIIACPLQLTNNTDKHIAFRLIDKSMESYLRLPLYGLVPPNTTYTLTVTTREKGELPGKNFIDVILQSAVHFNDVYTFKSQPKQFFQEMGNAVQEVKLKALYTLPRYNTSSSSKSISPTIKIICEVKDHGLTSLDTNKAKQCIIIGQKNGHVGLWDYSQRKVGSLQIPGEEVVCVRFIEREKWIVVGTRYGYVHVYNYETKMQKIKTLRAVWANRGLLSSLVVHPTKPYLLSAGTQMILWDKQLEVVRQFQYQFDARVDETIYHVACNPNDTFASVSSQYYKASNENFLVTIWSSDSVMSKSTLPGHSKKVNCMAFFTCHDQEFLVTGSDDHTAKVWYLQENICAYTLEDFVSPVTSVLYQPDIQTLIIGTTDGDIYLWNTTNCRTYSDPPTLTRIINIGCVGAVYHLAYAMGSVVIGKGNTVAIMDIDSVNYQEQSTDYHKQQLGADTTQHAQDTTSKEIAWSISELPILDVHPLELHFPYHPNEPISCSLDLTNNTNEDVAFRLVDRGGKSPWCFTKLPLYGIVPLKSTYTLVVTTKEEMKLKERKDFDLVIQSSFLENKYINLFQNQSESEQFFAEAKEFGNMVHEVILEPVYLQYEDITSQDQNILVKYNPDDLRSIDAHPTEPWILTGHRSGYARIWNHEMKYPINSFKVSDDDTVSIIKFIARKEWIVAVTASRYIDMYDCACVVKIKKIRRVEIDLKAENFSCHPALLAVHPALPYVLSPDLQLLDWDLGWKQTQRFISRVTAVAFNPWDQKSFAGACMVGYTVQVWRLDTTYPECYLRGHDGIVNCIDFIRLSGDQHYLVSGSTDCTAKIWDLHQKKCIYTLQAMSPVRCVLALQSLPVLFTGTEHGIIHVWSATDFRLKRTINLGGGGPVTGLVCLTGSQRIAIGQEKATSTMEIHDNEVLLPKSVTEVEPGQAKAEDARTKEPTSTEQQKMLPVKIAIEEKRSKAEGEHSKTVEHAATHAATLGKATRPWGEANCS